MSEERQRVQSEPDMRTDRGRSVLIGWLITAIIATVAIVAFKTRF